MIKNATLLFLLFLAGYPAVSQQIDTAKLNKYFQVLERNNKLMGSVAIAEKDELIYQKAIGYADVQQKKKADIGTTYGIGSISKTFTAALVLMAAEEDKINLDDQLDQFFPQIDNAEKISIEQLLRHRSGIPNFTDDTTYFNWNEKAKTRTEMLSFIDSLGSDFAPDSTSAYSNSNYLILSYILEDIHKNSFAEILQKKIIEPLELENTYLSEIYKRSKNESHSYRYTGDWEKQEKTHLSITLGAGGIFSTAEDLVKFSYALFSGKLINEKSLAKMMEIKEGLGLGLFQVPFYGLKGYGHTGGIDGYSSVFTFFGNDSISYALVSNGNNYMINDVSIAVLSAVFGMDYEIPHFETHLIKVEELDQYVGSYSSTQVPLKIVVRKENDHLVAQASGQPSFPLSPKSEDVFVYDPAGVEMVFKPNEKTFVLKQFGQEYDFIMEK